MYHVGRPGEDGYANRVLQAWGVDGHNSHTNVCSSSARLGHFLWCGADRPSPTTRTPRRSCCCRRISRRATTSIRTRSGSSNRRRSGATLITIDPRLSNTSAKADIWLPAYSGTEAALLLAIARILLEEELYNRDFVRKWVNWREYFRAERPDLPETFDSFVAALKDLYAQFTPEYAAAETGVSAAKIVEAARAIGRAGTRFATHNWRAAASGNLWGWQITRCLYLLVVLTGALGAVGGVNMHVTNKFVPKHPNPPPPPEYWNELLFPKEFPLAFLRDELSAAALPERRIAAGWTCTSRASTTRCGRIPTASRGWRCCRTRRRSACTSRSSPTWSETAWFADYILPMGLGTERHDTMSQETHAGQWLGFRQPVLRVAREKRGETDHGDARGEPRRGVGGSEFWVALSWKIDPDGSLGIRKFFESPYRPGQPITMDEYYGWMFENSVPGLPEAAAKEQLTPLALHAEVRRVQGLRQVLQPRVRARARSAELEGTTRSEDGETILRNGVAAGINVDGVACTGFNTPSRRLEFYSPTLAEWGWPEHALPTYVPGHVYWRDLKRDEGEFDLLPNFRLPTLIHTRSPVKWLYEISHSNPLWISTADARRFKIETGDLVKVRTRIGYFVTRAWVTEGIRPGVLAMSHHLGRWRLKEDQGGSRVASSLVRITRERRPVRDESGTRRAALPERGSRHGTHLVERGRRASEPDVPGAARSGQRHALLAPARAPRDGRPGRRYGDIEVDTDEAHEAYKEWMEQHAARTRPGRLAPSVVVRPAAPAVASAYKVSPD